MCLCRLFVKLYSSQSAFGVRLYVRYGTCIYIYMCVCGHIHQWSAMPSTVVSCLQALDRLTISHTLGGTRPHTHTHKHARAHTQLFQPSPITLCFSLAFTRTHTHTHISPVPARTHIHPNRRAVLDLHPCVGLHFTGALHWVPYPLPSSRHLRPHPPGVV